MSTATPYQIAQQRLRHLAENHKTPAAVAGDLSLVLLMAAECERAQASLDAIKSRLRELCDQSGKHVHVDDVREIIGDNDQGAV